MCNQRNRFYNSFEISIQVELITVTVFLFITHQLEFCSVHNQQEKCHYDLISVNLKEYNRGDSISVDYEPNGI